MPAKFFNDYLFAKKTLSLLTHFDVKKILLPDMSILVFGNINLSAQKLEALPNLSNVRLFGDFSCAHNRLKDLLGAPMTVRGSFDCSNNMLLSLTGAPVYVRGDFCCDINSLPGLTGAPATVNGKFSCLHNFMSTLDGAPRYIGSTFDCSANCKHLR